MLETNSNCSLVTCELTETTTAPLSNEDRVKEITTEILHQKEKVACSFIQIGKLLDEARGHLKKEGQWLNWLESSVDISVRMAQRYIQLAKTFPDTSSMTHLGTTKALALLKLPEGQREAFINEPHEVNGEQKLIGDMSVRELQNLIRDQTKPSKESSEIAKTTEKTDVAVQKSRVDYKGDGVYEPFHRKKSKPKSEESPDSSCLEELASDIESAQTHLDGILEVLKSKMPNDFAQSKVADELRSLYEKVLECLCLVKLEAHTDLGDDRENALVPALENKEHQPVYGEGAN